MPKINPVKILTPINRNIVKKSTKNAPKIEQQIKSNFDFSTENRGFYLYKGKIINIVFPR